MADSTTLDVLRTLMPGGVVAALALIYNAWKSWREIRRKDDEALLHRWKDELNREHSRTLQLERDLDFAEKEADWYRNRAGQLEFVLRSRGLDVPPVIVSQPARKE